MSDVKDMRFGAQHHEADRLFRETDLRQAPRGDGRLMKWLSPAKPGSRAEQIGSMITTAFATFCLVGGLSMMLGMGFLPALGVSLAVFAMLRVFMAMV